MENEDIVRELAEHGERIKVVNKKIADLEEQQQHIQDLSLLIIVSGLIQYNHYFRQHCQVQLQ